MLKILRKKGVYKKIFWVVATAVILTFVFWGTNTSLQNRDQDGVNYAGKIFGETISKATFIKNYNNARVHAIIQYGNDYKKMLPFLNLEAQTWDRLILLHEANKRKITISDQGIIKAIEEYKFFQRDGQFDTLLYNDILRYIFQMQPRVFEESVRDDLKIIKIFEAETTAAALDEQEVLEAYKKQNEKIQISYVLVTADKLKGQIPVEENEAQTYFNEHKNEFLMPPAVNVFYLTLGFLDNAQDADKDKIREQADNIYQALRSNPDINEAAKQNSLEVKESGFFSSDKPNLSLGWPFELLNKIAQSDINKIIEPIETPEGLIIATVKEKKDSYVPEYSEVALQVKDALTLKKAKELANQKAKELSQAIKEKYNSSLTKDFPDIAKSMGLEIYQTPSFSSGQYLPKIGIAKEFQEAAFQLNDQNKISDTVEVPQGFAILHFDAHAPVDMKQYEKDKQAFGQTMFEEKKKEAFINFLSRLRLKANLIDHISKLQENSNQ